MTTFIYDKHVSYIKKVANDVESFEYLVSQYIRMSGVYWGMTAMAMLGQDLKLEMNSDALVEWVLECQDGETGGFGGNKAHDTHILYSLAHFSFYFCVINLSGLTRKKSQTISLRCNAQMDHLKEISGAKLTLDFHIVLCLLCQSWARCTPIRLISPKLWILSTVAKTSMEGLVLFQVENLMLVKFFVASEPFLSLNQSTALMQTCSAGGCVRGNVTVVA